jgi:DGQHR domain-containing protein
MNLLCSIFFDIPSSVQAEIFATINYNQKPVDKSLAYQLFGYTLDKKSSTEWEPDNLALHIARIFDKKKDSPFFEMIKSGAEENGPRHSKKGFVLSTAAVVEGVVKLFSSNPIKDRYKINKRSIFKNGREKLKDVRSTAPLRMLYIANEDRKIYDIVSNFFEVAMDKIISPSVESSKIRSTIGILALFDTLKHVLQCQTELMASKDYYATLLKPCEAIDFSNDYFSAAGIGRGRIKNALILSLDIDSDHHSKVVSRMREETKSAIEKLPSL